MKGSIRFPSLFIFSAVALLLGMSLPESECKNLTAVVSQAAGRVGFKKGGVGGILPVQVNMTRLTEGDVIITSDASIATLRVEGKTVPGGTESPSETTIEIGPKSRVMMTNLFADLESGNEQVRIGLAEGQIISNVRRIDTNSERFEVETPTAIAAVRGTRFLSDVQRKGDKFLVAFRVERGSIDLFSRTTGGRLGSLMEGDTADIDPAGGVSIGAAGGAGAKGPSGITSGRGGGPPRFGGPPPTGESSDTANTPSLDDEGDDIGNRQ